MSRVGRILKSYANPRCRVCITVSNSLDCSQSPIFLWDFRDSYASTELPPSLFVRASTTWGECLNYRGGPNQVTLRSVKILLTPTCLDDLRLYKHRKSPLLLALIETLLSLVEFFTFMHSKAIV